MSEMWKRILKNGSLVVISLLVFGYLMGQLAVTWVSGQGSARVAVVESDLGQIGGNLQKQDPLAQTLTWRIPITLAVIGLIMVTFFEMLASLWRPKPIPKTNITTVNQTEVATKEISFSDETEETIQKLLREAERNPLITPAPVNPPKLESFQV